MFDQISWTLYIKWVGISLFFYYMFVLYKYYYTDFKNILNKSSQLNKDFMGHSLKTSLNDDSTPPWENSPNDFYNQNSEINYPMIASLNGEIEAYFKSPEIREFDKEKIVHALKKILSKYPAIKASPFRISIQELIHHECQHNCSVHLDEDTLVGLWESDGASFLNDQ